MILYFHFQNYLYEYPLPACNDRRVRLDLSEELGENLGIVEFEVWDHVWHILSGNGIMLTVDSQNTDDHIMRTGDIINGYLVDSSVAFAITVHAVDKSHTLYKKYSFSGRDTLEIGGDSKADINITDSYISGRHATLMRDGQDIVICDHSTNGTYVQNRRVKEKQKLDLMDVIYITGVKLIFMGDFLAINQLEKCKIKLEPYKLPAISEAENENSSDLIRSPRMLEPLDTEAVELESPPAPNSQKRQPVIFTIGPAVTMPLPILASMMFSGSQGSGYYMGTIMSVLLSAVIAAGWAVANLVYSKSADKKAEAFRKEAYQKYIEENEAHLQQKQHKNASILNGQFLSLDEILSVLSHNKAVLWNRNVNQPDFLSVRLGIGYIHFQCEIVVPKRRFSLVADPMQSEPHKLRDKYRYIPNTTSLLNLRDTKIIGVLGSKARVRHIAGIIALQTAALHCYTDVKMAFILRSGEKNYYDWAGPLPHVRWQENKLRLMSTDDTERQNVLFHLNGVLRARMEEEKENSSEKKPHLPHIIIFCTDPDLISGENIYRYLADNGKYGVTFILLYEHLDKLPNECSHIIQHDSDYSGYYQIDKGRDQTNVIRFDSLEPRMSKRLSRTISGYIVTEQSSGEIPSSISFLDMYGINAVEEWDLIKRWKENRTYESMRALVGIGTNGKPLYLDIHEKQHGPHGLIAGTTGSGKSETIQTYILSLVMNFHPHEISLILIDYKGGGMANVFLGLPHLAGTITNLDGNQTIRALRSIKAEIKRRQTLFNQFNVNHIDNYSRHFREGTATEPMPHLIIISDEFAELKKEQPEFIKELVSTARVGRSLGVHLILATQKPSGVVDDEIWSNSRFKLCLRVQDKQDSNEMLHRSDAAYLTHTGRAYMQIGNDEVFEMFQSGYSGAYYEPDGNSPEDTMITMIGLDGSPLILRQKKASSEGENRPTQLSAAVDFISGMAGSLGIQPVRKLWLPELQEGITLEDIQRDYLVPEVTGLHAIYGLVDDPSTQMQYAGIIDFTQTGNLLIAGMPGMGKSTMIQTILYSLVMNYSSDEVNFYCVDCSSSMTRVFAKLPQCGGIVTPEDSERVYRLFQLLQSISTERSNLFQKAEVGSFEEYCLVATEPLPAVIVVIDNLFAFNERYADLVDEQLVSLSHTCVKYGIHLVISVNHTSDIKFKLRQNFDQALPLLLAERGDYHDALGVMPEFMPPARKGRGLFGKEALEYQAALPVEGENEQVRTEAIRASFDRIKQGKKKAMEIKFIPKEQIYADFVKEHSDGESFCIGYNKADISLISVPLQTTYCYAVSGANHKSANNMMLNFMYMAKLLGGKRHSVSLKYNLDSSDPLDAVYRDDGNIFELLKLLREEFTNRSAIRRECLETQENFFEIIREKYGLLFVFIDSMTDFLNLIYESHEEDYFPLVELFFKQGKGLGVYFIAAFEVSVYGSGLFHDAYKNFVEHGTGIHIGGQLDKQKLFDVPFISRDDIRTLEITDGITMTDDQLTAVFVPPNSLRED